MEDSVVGEEKKTFHKSRKHKKRVILVDSEGFIERGRRDSKANTRALANAYIEERSSSFLAR